MLTKNEDQHDEENIARETFGGVPAFYRPNTTDENALKEVLVKRTYRQPTVSFDVEAGEHWLDLGANVGAFALYCQSKGATAECYEPLPDNFALLQKNVPQFECHPTAISNRQEPEVTFWTSRKPHDHYRGTLLERGKGHPQVTVKNTHASALLDRKFDGIKMDIEGSEFGLIDEWLLPKANKLVLEMHTSRDNNLENLARRIGILKQHYQHVHYCPELARLVERGTGAGKTYHDRIVYCWNDRAEATSVGGAAPLTITSDPDDDDHIVRAQQAWARLKESGPTSWEDWKLVGAALMTGRQHAMKVAPAKTPRGSRYTEAFSIWLQIHGFDAIDKADRTKLLSIMEDLDRIEKWREQLTEGQRAAWNAPSTVWRISRCKTRGIKAVIAKAEAPIPNVKDLPPQLADKFEEENEQRVWQIGLEGRARKAIDAAKLEGPWLLLEPPTRAQVTLVEDAILAWEITLEYLRSIQEAPSEGLADAQSEPVLEAA